MFSRVDQARVTQLLNHLEEHAQDPLIHSAFMSFRNALSIFL